MTGCTIVGTIRVAIDIAGSIGRSMNRTPRRPGWDAGFGFAPISGIASLAGVGQTVGWAGKA